MKCKEKVKQINKKFLTLSIGQHLHASKKLFSKEYYHFNLYQHEMGHKKWNTRICLTLVR